MAHWCTIILSIFCILFHVYRLYLSDYSDNYEISVNNSKSLRPPNPHKELPPSASILHVYDNAAICSDNYECSIIGRKILERSGSAVDAAIATLFCNGLLAMQSMGIGGGMFMNIYERRQRRSFSIISREIAPFFIQPQTFAEVRNNSELQQSSLSIAVPGELMGYALAHERFGKLQWRELVKPTIDLCHSGYLLTKHQYDALHMNRIMIMRDAHLRHMFVDPKTEDFWLRGEHITPPPELCQTYEYLAEEGPKSFYNGTLSKLLLEDLEEMNSRITKFDLLNINSSLVESIMIPLGEQILYVLPPPSSGCIVGFVMNILRKFKNHFMHTSKMGTLEIHRITEALKFGFVKRWELDTANDKKFLDHLLCIDFAQSLANLINDSKTFSKPEFYGAKENLHSRVEVGTTHISVLAPSGDAVSVTSSINFYFGSGRMGRRTGVLFNNAMSDFSIDHLPNYFHLPNLHGKNRIHPHKSPMSSMAPIIITDRATGDVRLVVGAAGGSKIITALVQLLVRTLWMQQNIKQAVDAARFHHQLLPNKLEYEYGVLDNYIKNLEEMGHRTERYRVRGSAVCGIEQRGGKIYANADYRKDAGVAGL